ncbi:MAG: MurT ligase domain-containing protein [Ruminococcus sp.]|nr:MurT ligase domain-containing protein [Ruminococcus sp.]
MKLTKWIPKISGSTWPGGIAGILMKNFVKYFSFPDNTRIVMVTGTSGKTTTTGMVAELIRSSGKSICTNELGANMDRGVATALISHSDMSGCVDVDYVVLEVDERYLRLITKLLKPHVIIMTNILKDQSQRNGEPGIIMRKIREAITDDVHLILNRDEPNNASFGFKHPSVEYYGVQGAASYKTENSFTVSCVCPVCSGIIRYEYENMLSVGKFACENCDMKSEENAAVVSLVGENTISIGGRTFKAKYLSTYFLYCYASLIAFAAYEGFSDKQLQKSMENFTIQSGRTEDLDIGDKMIHYLRMKQETPITLQNSIDVTYSDPSPKVVVLDLSEVVDFQPHYTGNYYSYDCDFGKLEKSNVIKYICMSKTVCYDAAVRLILEGIPKDKITVIPTDDYDVLIKELEQYDCKQVYLLTWMHSYYKCLGSVEKYRKARGLD